MEDIRCLPCLNKNVRMRAHSSAVENESEIAGPGERGVLNDAVFIGERDATTVSSHEEFAFRVGGKFDTTLQKEWGNKKNCTR